MRARLDITSVSARLNVPFLLRVMVQNDTAEIRNVTVRIPMLPTNAYQVRPLNVSIFPNEVTELEVEITLPLDTPAGEGLLAVEMVDDRNAVARLDCTVDVAPRDLIDMSISPRQIIGGRKATIIATVENRGNRPTGVSVTAGDTDRRLRYEIEPRSATLEMGESVAFRVVAKGRRPFFGNSNAAAITVMAESRAQHESSTATFQSKPYLSRGLLTIFMLAGILILWVVVFSAGFRAALSGQEAKKSVAATFASGAKPDPTVSIGSISGRVFAASDSRALARMVVTATPITGERPPTAASTDEDGAFTIGGLAPGRYELVVTGAGYTETPIEGEFRIRPADALALDPVFVVGDPAVVTGAVSAAGAIPSATVEARMMVGDAPGSFLVTATVDAAGAYRIEGLQSPARYRLTFTASGFDPVQLFQEVAPGESVTLPTVQMTSGPGSVVGMVVDQDGLPLGGAEVIATAGAAELSTVTATSGTDIGSFILADLPSPATYLVQVSLEGYGTQTLTVRVGPGQTVELATPVVLSQGTGLVQGRVFDQNGVALGGVSITASNGLPVGQTFTVDANGAYVLRGLPVPGSYTLTFQLEGYRTEVLFVELPIGGGSATVNVSMRSETATATGVVVDGDGDPLGGVPVLATSGDLAVSSLSTDPTGGFRLDGLRPGWWTIVFGEPTAPGAVLLVEIGRGANDLGEVEYGG